MKNLVLTLIGAGMALSLSAQDAVATKKVQLGMAYQFGLNFNKTATKIAERDGAGVQNMIGMNMNYSFNQNIGLSTGLEFDFESFKYKITTTDPLYYKYIDTDIQQKEDNPSTYTLYELTNRKQKAIYVTIPTMLLFRTNMMGDFRYYGKFGARTSFLLKSTVNDDGFNITGNVPGGTKVAASNENMRSPGDMFFMRSTIGLAGGAEWNFTGNTSMFAEIGFYYGFTPVHYGDAITGDDKERDMTLYTSGLQNGTGTDDYSTMKATQRQIVLKLGILF